jgi:hypothetical protein
MRLTMMTKMGFRLSGSGFKVYGLGSRVLEIP